MTLSAIRHSAHRLLRALPTGQGFQSETLAVGLVAIPLLVFYFSPNLAIAIVSTLLFLLAIWWRLDLGLLAVIAAAPFYRFPKELDLGLVGFLVGRASSVAAVSLAEYALLLCALAWLLRHMVAPEEEVQRESPRKRASSWLLWGPPALLVAVATISLFFSEYLRVALREYRVVVLEPAIYYLLLVHTLRSSREVRYFLSGLVLLGFAMALYSLYHYFFVGVVEATGGVRRILAVYHSPNALALFLGRIIPVAIALALGLSRVQHGWRRATIIPMGAAVLMLAVFYLTFSRGAWLGLIAAAMFLFFATDRRGALLTLAGILVLGLALVPVLPWERLLSATPFVQRLLVWQAALAMVLDHPLTGVGLDNFLYYYPQYILPQAALEPDISHAHNVFLDFWSRLGILGLVTLVWLQYQFWRMGVGVLQRASAAQERWLALALMASMVDFLVHGLIDNSYFLIDLAYIFWLTYGLLAVLYHRPSSAALTTGSTPT